MRGENAGHIFKKKLCALFVIGNSSKTWMEIIREVLVGLETYFAVISCDVLSEFFAHSPAVGTDQTHTLVSLLGAQTEWGPGGFGVGLVSVAPEAVRLPLHTSPWAALVPRPLLFLTRSWPTDPLLTQLFFLGSLSAL